MLALLPAAAAAQSAGDEQYADPFGDEPEQPSPATPAPTPAPAGAGPAGAGDRRARGRRRPRRRAAAPAQAAQLPRTGWDAGVPGVLGLVLMSAGVALRAHVRRAA